MLMDSVTVLLHRLGVAYKAIMNPMFRVRRGPTGELLDIRPAAEADTPATASTRRGSTSSCRGSVDHRALAEAERLLPSVLADARQVALDSRALNGDAASVWPTSSTPTRRAVPRPDRKDVAALLRWLADGHFVLLGYQRCPVQRRAGVGRPVEPPRRAPAARRDLLPQLTDSDDLLVLAQATMPSFLRYGAYPYIVVVREHPGRQAVEHRFVGLFTVAAMNANVLEIPLISRRVDEAIAMAQRDPSHPGQLLLDIIQTIPRSELFALSARELLDMAMAVVDLGSRRRTLLFLRADQLAHFVSCLVYLPRDRYTTAVRLEMQDILVRELGGESIEYTARVSESPWAVVHFTVRLPEDSRPQDVDVSLDNETRIQDLLTEAARTWGDRLLGAVKTGSIDQAKAEHYATAFPEVYKQAFAPTTRSTTSRSSKSCRTIRSSWCSPTPTRDEHALLDLVSRRAVGVAERIAADAAVHGRGGARGAAVHRDPARRLPVWIYQFKISLHQRHPRGARRARTRRDRRAVRRRRHRDLARPRRDRPVQRAGAARRADLAAGRRAAQLRKVPAAGRFSVQPGPHRDGAQRQPGHGPVAGRTVRGACSTRRPIADARTPHAQAAAAAVAADIDALASLDTDRVLRAFASMIQATLRTNYFVSRQDSARAQNVLAIKLNPRLIDELPLPRPKFEIFVYSPRVEGVHLRFGFVARGGLRWSDRREDFRTEILGLVKAQAVKNAVIVPVGAKGGFVVKQPPLPTGDAAADRDAQRAEGIACYRLFISGLLDLTDNVDQTTGNVVTPADVVRRDGDDAYLVVAADKGTATFSDIANEVAKSYGFWLGDAFASGGSVGYDHKAMGITAKGAWESVKRHFREMGVDTQSEDFTVVGIGDMSGDVFGNGMLLSQHIRLVAAFNHLHVFLDPNPDAATSWEERKRMFELPRSTWDDYDTSLISEGGGVYSREQKSIPISPQVRTALGIEDDVDELPPPELLRRRS